MRGHRYARKILRAVMVGLERHRVEVPLAVAKFIVGMTADYLASQTPERLAEWMLVRRRGFSKTKGRHKWPKGLVKVTPRRIPAATDEEMHALYDLLDVADRDGPPATARALRHAIHILRP